MTAAEERQPKEKKERRKREEREMKERRKMDASEQKESRKREMLWMIAKRQLPSPLASMHFHSRATTLTSNIHEQGTSKIGAHRARTSQEHTRSKRTRDTGANKRCTRKVPQHWQRPCDSLPPARHPHSSQFSCTHDTRLPRSHTSPSPHTHTHHKGGLVCVCACVCVCVGVLGVCVRVLV